MSIPRGEICERAPSSSVREEISFSKSSILELSKRTWSILEGRSPPRESLTGPAGTGLVGPDASTTEAAALALTSSRPTSSEPSSGEPSENPSSLPS